MRRQTTAHTTDLYGETGHHIQAAGGTRAGLRPVALEGGDAAAAGAGVGGEGGMVRGPGGGRRQHHRLDQREAGVLDGDVGGWPVADSSVGQPPRVLRLVVSGLGLGERNQRLENNKTKTCGEGRGEALIFWTRRHSVTKTGCDEDNGNDNYNTEIIKYSGEQERLMMEVTAATATTRRKLQYYVESKCQH